MPNMDRFAPYEEVKTTCPHCQHKDWPHEFIDNDLKCPRDDDHPVCPSCDYCQVCHQDVDMIEWDVNMEEDM